MKILKLGDSGTMVNQMNLICKAVAYTAWNLRTWYLTAAHVKNVLEGVLFFCIIGMWTFVDKPLSSFSFKN